MDAYVYAVLVDGVARYVGKGRGGRLRDHERVARRVIEGDAKSYQPTKFHLLLAEAIRAGAVVTAKKVIVNLTDDEALTLEKRAITAAPPGQLWNVRSGGNPGVASELMRETWNRPGFRKKMAAVTSEKWKDEGYRALVIARLKEAAAKRDTTKDAKAAVERWRRPDYAAKQKAARASHEYKTALSKKIRDQMTEDLRAAFGAAVKSSWSDPEKRSSRLEKRRISDAKRFTASAQFAVLEAIRSAEDGISTRAIYAAFPNARGAIEKLTKKSLIEKRGGKHGLFFAKEG